MTTTTTKTTTAPLIVMAAIGLAACTPTAGMITDAGSPINTCIHTCTPDPGWKPADCVGAEAGLEFFQTPIVNFETPGTGGFIGQYMYAYGDGTSNVDLTAGYQPAAVQASRCGNDTNNHVLHMTGGPFLGWGGGLGVAMEHITQDGRLCPMANLADPVRPGYCPPASAGFAVSYAALDMSAWEGVAVWARRGPDSQALLRVLVGNKDTDDDISFLMYGNDPTERRYCDRVRQCSCGFQDAPCANYSNASPPVYSCGPLGSRPGVSGSMGTSNNNYCDVSMCDDIYPAFQVQDPEFVGRPCTPYAYRNGTQLSLCYDPVGDPGDPSATPPRPARAADPPPANPDQQCGDHWTFPLHLTTEWQLFLVPFNTMYQQGWAKKIPTFDLKSISVVRLTWEAGYVDYWIDDVRFYRHAKQ